MTPRAPAVACIVALGLLAAGCGGSGGQVEGIRASASDQATTTTTATTTAPPETTTSSTEAPGTTTTSSSVRPATTTTRAPATTSTTGRATTTAPTTTPTTRVPGDTRRAVGWDRYVASPDGRTLTFTYYSGVPPCSIDDGIQAEESSSAVRVTIFERDGSNGQPCIAIAQQKSATVSLSSPLNGRTVVDGARS
jgi:hypothetical protein